METQRIAKNTLLLSIRQLLILCILLYTSRVVLKALGVEDYGIYQLVGSIVSMMIIVTGALTSAIQRFITFALACNCPERLSRVFSMAINIHIALAILVLILIETVGVWWVHYKINIDPSRINAAMWILQSSAFTLIMQLLSIPFSSLVIANERMDVYASITLGDAFLKLIIALFLPNLHGDKLIIYAYLLAFNALIASILYFWFCKKTYKDCRYHFSFDNKIIKEIGSFAGWNLLGNGATVLSNQGVSILVNTFFNVTMNAARGIALQVEYAVSGFINSFMMAMNPQITKSYAQNRIENMHKLIMGGSKFSFFLVMILTIPILIQTEDVLALWLEIPPKITALFVRLSLINVILNTLVNPINTAMSATGKIKIYQIVTGLIQLSVFPLSYIGLKNGLPAESVYVVAIFVTVCSLFFRVAYSCNKVMLPLKLYIYNVLVRIVFVVPIIVAVSYYVYSIIHMDNPFIQFCIISTIMMVLSSCVIWLIGLQKNERSSLKRMVQNRIHK